MPINVMEVKNAFNQHVLEIKDVLKDAEIETVIQSMRKDVFNYLGLSDEKSDAVMTECLGLARSCENVQEYERLAHEILQIDGVNHAIPDKLAERAQIAFNQIRKYILPGSVLDLGCGDARLSQLLEKAGFTMELADVYENPNISICKLPFNLLGQCENIPYENDQFDNTLLITVLHHCDNPIQVINEARRVTRPNGIIIVIESVYGVDGEALDENERAKANGYLTLTAEQQLRINIFFDHFYNRVIHYSDDPFNKVNVPFNFNTPENWKSIFEQNGLNQTQLKHLGADQPLVPEYHTLHVLTVKK